MTSSRTLAAAVAPLIGPATVESQFEGSINLVLKLRAKEKSYGLRLRVREDIYRYAPDLMKESVVALAVKAPWLPRLLHADATRTLLPHPFALYEWAEGAPLWDSPSPALYAAAGRVLRELHETAVPAAAADRLSPEREKPWAERFRRAWAHELRELNRRGTSCRLGRLRLAGVEPPAPCLVHNDFSGANIIVQDGGIAGLIDWDNALYEAPELDLVKMRHWTRRGKSALEHDPALWRAFLDGYGNGALAGTPRFALYRRLWLMRVLNFELSRGKPAPGYPPASAYEAALAELVE